MNLSFVDFRGAVFSPGTWRGSNLSESAFTNATAAGPLTCVGCTFKWKVYAGTAYLRNGRWVRLVPGKPPAYVD
jgi:uncharacterized protein YjbI with pentapeptide repeats